MKQTKIYISGQISGLTPEEYTANFTAAATRLTAQGYAVINPLNNGVDPSEPWREQIRPKAERSHSSPESRRGSQEAPNRPIFGSVAGSCKSLILRKRIHGNQE